MGCQNIGNEIAHFLLGTIFLVYIIIICNSYNPIPRCLAEI